MFQRLTRRPKLDGYLAASMTQVFQGVRADDVLAQRLTDALLATLDTVQEWCAQNRVTPTVQWVAGLGGV